MEDVSPTPDQARIGGVISRAAISTLGMAAQGAARFVYTLAIGRFAGPELLGETSALLAVAVFVSLFWPAPAGLAASRFLPLPDIAGPAMTVLRRSLLPAVTIIAIIAGIAAWLLGSEIAAILGCVAVTIGYAGYVFVRGVLIGEDRINRAALTDTITAAIGIAVLVLVLFANLHWALLLPLALSYALFAVLSWPRQAGTPTQAQRTEVRVFTRDSAIANVATGGLLPAVSTLILAFDTPYVAGLFAAGLSLATPANQISQALTQVLVPQFSRMHVQATGDARSMLRRLLMLSFVGFGVIYGALIALSPWILELFYGSDYVAGALSMQLIMAGVCAMSIIAAPLAFLQATGHQRINATIWAVSLGLALVVMVSAGPFFGQSGVLAGFLLGSVGGSVAVIISSLVLSRQPSHP